MPTDVETFMNEFYDTPLTKREAMVERWFARLRNDAIERCAKLAERYPSSGEQTEEPVEFWIRRLSHTSQISGADHG